MHRRGAGPAQYFWQCAQKYVARCPWRIVLTGAPQTRHGCPALSYTIAWSWKWPDSPCAFEKSLSVLPPWCTACSST
jgi:hypothetical protein